MFLLPSPGKRTLFCRQSRSLFPLPLPNSSNVRLLHDRYAQTVVFLPFLPPFPRRASIRVATRTRRHPSPPAQGDKVSLPPQLAMTGSFLPPPSPFPTRRALPPLKLISSFLLFKLRKASLLSRGAFPPLPPVRPNASHEHSPLLLK